MQEGIQTQQRLRAALKAQLAEVTASVKALKLEVASKDAQLADAVAAGEARMSAQLADTIEGYSALKSQLADGASREAALSAQLVDTVEGYAWLKAQLAEGAGHEAALKAQLVDYGGAAGGAESVAPANAMSIQKLEARLTEVGH